MKSACWMSNSLRGWRRFDIEPGQVENSRSHDAIRTNVLSSGRNFIVLYLLGKAQMEAMKSSF